MQCSGSHEGVIGIKDKYHDVIDALTPVLPPGVRIFPLTDTYPAGDEFLMVHDITGRVIPPGGLPRDVGTVVCNVETLVNIGEDRPVTHKYLTVAGAVARPVTLRVPVGDHDRRSDPGRGRRHGSGVRRTAWRRDDGPPRAVSGRTGH
jgi:Na+-translocating ferredoxin:NAD+ oxidoreductase RnfC subunit